MQTNHILSSLEEYAFLRVLGELEEFSQEGASYVRITIPSRAAAFGSFVQIEVEIDVSALSLEEPRADTVHLFDIWTNWPPTQGNEQSRRAISVFDVHGQMLPDETRVIIETDQKRDRTTVLLRLNSFQEYDQRVRRLKVRFTSPNIYFLMPERRPFARSLLNFKLEFKRGPRRVICDLEHPSDLSLRTRVDNSNYHSLAYSEELAVLRKLTFFESRLIEIKWYWGTSNPDKLLRPALPLGSAAVSAFALALSLLLNRIGLEEFAATVFALALLPPAFGIFSQRLLFFPSADIRRMSYTDMALYISLLVYVIVFAFGITSLFYPSLLQYGVRVSLILGAITLALALFYFLFVSMGTLQKYTCDQCERWIYLRSSAKLHVPTRKTLCNRCWKMTETSTRVQLDTQEDAP